jgi:poly-gamma-glutamate synthesis protein (capsule biosynthesis protein)
VRFAWGLVVIAAWAAACGSPDASPAHPVAATAGTAATTAAPAPPACGDWRFAVVAGPFEVADSISRADLAARWLRGDLAASPDTEAALAPILGKRAPSPLADHPAFDATHWGIVPVHELSPAYTVVPVDGHHPLDGDGGLLVARVCGKPVARDFDRSKLTTLVMSGTTALTGATAEHIDSYGIADTIKDIAPFFTSADLDHISNEVTFVHDCKPWTGQKSTELIFCSRDSYIELLAALHITIVELTGSHLLDYGHSSLERTLDLYEKRGWVWFGGGRTQIEATAPRFVTDHGNKLAFVGCNHVNWWIERIFVGSGGANCDYARMTWQIQDLRRRGYTVIASVQHRELTTHKPDWDLVADLRGLAEAGATFVEGSQAHTAHPWDVHHGAFVHYGPGNTLFAQYPEVQRDAVVDKLYIYDGRLLTVARLLIRSEHGWPHAMTPGERAHFLAQMTEAEAGIAPADPWAPVVMKPVTRDRPDSLVARGKSQKITVTVPAGFADGDGKSYGLVVDLDDSARDGSDSVGAFVVHRKADVLGKWKVATGDEIATFMAAKYPIDAARVRVTDDPAMGKRGTLVAVAKPLPPPVVIAKVEPRPPPPTPPVVVARVEPPPAPPPPAAPDAGIVVTISKPVNGVRRVSHRHHHELDYFIDASGARVSPPS